MANTERGILDTAIGAEQRTGGRHTQRDSILCGGPVLSAKEKMVEERGGEGWREASDTERHTW